MQPPLTRPSPDTIHLARTRNRAPEVAFGRSARRRWWDLLGAGLALTLLLSACVPLASPAPPPPDAAETVPAAPTSRQYRPTPTAAPRAPVPTSSVPVDDLIALVDSKLPKGKLADIRWNAAAVIPLVVPAGQPPLWAAYSAVLPGLVQVVAIYTRDGDRWRELVWRLFTQDDIAVTQNSYVAGPGAVRTAAHLAGSVRIRRHARQQLQSAELRR